MGDDGSKRGDGSSSGDSRLTKKTKVSVEQIGAAWRARQYMNLYFPSGRLAGGTMDAEAWGPDEKSAVQALVEVAAAKARRKASAAGAGRG